MKAVIIDGEWKPERKLAPLIRRHGHICTLPVFNKPIIQHTLELLQRNGVTNVIVVSSDSSAADLESALHCVRSEGQIEVHICEQSRPRGTAGILKDAMDLLNGQPFLVIHSNLYIEDVDLKGLVDFHDLKGAVITVGVKRRVQKDLNIETVSVSREGALKEIRILHHSIDRRSPWVSSGIYVVTPAAFDFIDAKSYLDIKEQLIPLLQAASLPVCAHELEGYYKEISSANDYLAVHRDLFDIDSKAISSDDRVEIAEGVWVGRDSTISPRSYLIGPLVLGNKCQVAAHTQIIGPAVIGDECEIGEGASVRESVLWHNVSLEPGARSERCIVAENVNVAQGERLRNMMVADSLRVDGVGLLSPHYDIVGVGRKNLSRQLGVRIRNWAYLLAKRAMDILGGLALLVILSPVLIVVALAVRFSSDSPGPVFHIQKRCGKNGKTFKMLKFRTMVVAAEEMQGELQSQKDSDGPMFKMANDPRITRVGAKLRATSLDEFPQLLNVLKGDMSLVGPRPLVMEEMKFSPSWREVRLSVKPGMTGLWQIQGRSEAPFHNWIRYDVEYVMNRSLWMDIVILFKTVSVVFKRLGAY